MSSLRGCFLGVHRIRRHNPPLHRQHVQQSWQGRDLTRLCVHRNLNTPIHPNPRRLVRQTAFCDPQIFVSRNSKKVLIHRARSRILCPAAQRITLIASPSAPARWLLLRRPSSFICPMTGSMAFRLRLSRRMVGEVIPVVWLSVISNPSRLMPWPR